MNTPLSFQKSQLDGQQLGFFGDSLLLKNKKRLAVNSLFVEGSSDSVRIGIEASEDGASWYLLKGDMIINKSYSLKVSSKFVRPIVTASDQGMIDVYIAGLF